MAFILWPGVNENLKPVLSWWQQSAGFSLCSILNRCRYWRQPTTSWTLPRAHAVALSLSSCVQIHLSQLCSSCLVSLSVCFIQKRKPSLRSVWTNLCAQSVKKHMTERSPGTDPCWAPWPNEHLWAVWPNLICTNLHIQMRPWCHQKPVDLTNLKRYITGKTKEPKWWSN